MKGIKWWLCLGMLIAVLYGSARTGMAEDPAIARGLDWLQAQVRGDGTLLSEDGSLAVVEQTRSEVAHTLAQTGRTVALPDLTLRPTSDLSTELLARRAIGLGAVGRTQDAADVVTVLMGRGNADGGFGGAAGQPSNPLDTSLALLAMRAGGVARNTRAQAALGYLGGAAGADGAYAFGQPTYTTAYALQALSRYRNDYSLATAIQRTRAALIARQSGGSYGDPVSDAVATIALSLSGPSADAAGAVTALRNAQLADGSWQQDPYVTALALRALTIAVDPPSTNAGRILGAQRIRQHPDQLHVGAAEVTRLRGVHREHAQAALPGGDRRGDHRAVGARDRRPHHRVGGHVLHEHQVSAGDEVEHRVAVPGAGAELRAG